MIYKVTIRKTRMIEVDVTVEAENESEAVEVVEVMDDDELDLRNAGTFVTPSDGITGVYEVKGMDQPCNGCGMLQSETGDEGSGDGHRWFCENCMDGMTLKRLQRLQAEKGGAA